MKTSEYLNDLARRNIEGEITIDEVEQLLNSYYESKTTREADYDDKQEADKASKNIKRILSAKTCDFSTNGYISLYRRIFEGVMKHAGELRKYAPPTSSVHTDNNNIIRLLKVLKSNYPPK